MRLVVKDGRLVRFEDSTRTFDLDQQKFRDHTETCPGCTLIYEAFNRGELTPPEAIVAANLAHSYRWVSHAQR